jgi:three-Cys-motif partner protein
VSTQNFFDESREQSQVKTAIVTKYFWAWAKVILPSVKKHSGKIAYIDLFAGPGRYKDGTSSTPLLILQQAIADPDMRKMLVTIFNDVDENNTHTLQSVINALPDVDTLRYKPAVSHHEVGYEIVKLFESMKLVPTLFFVDPWGYKGLSLQLINSVLKNWGCDCIFFFNYNRINMGLRNPIVESHMKALFGEERADTLRMELEKLGPAKKELAIVEAIGEALREMGGKFVLPFRFRSDGGNRTSHHLIFVSKHIRGYEIMKEIMAKESSTTEQGVASFEYNPALGNQGLLFDLARPLDDLGKLLLEKFPGRTMSMIDVYNEHHVGTPFIKQNYKDVLGRLETADKITAQPPADKRRKNTFADAVNVTFPRRERS